MACLSTPVSHVDHPQELQDIVREQFDLGDTEIEFHTSCRNISNSGISVKIAEQVWGEVIPYIGCLSVIVRDRPVGEHRVRRLYRQLIDS